MSKRSSNQPRSRLNDNRRAPNVSRNTRPASYSYHQNRSTENGKSDRGKNNDPTKRQANPNKIKLIVALVIIIILFVLELPVTAPAKIVVQSPASAAAKVPISQYQAASEHILGSSLLNHTKLTLNQARLATKLETQFPEIKDASVSYSPLSYHPTIKLTMSPPKLALETANGIYLVEDSGNVIGRAAKGVSLPLVIDQSNIEPEPGKPLLPAGYVNFISQMLAQLKANSLSVTKMTLPPTSSQLDIQVKGEKYFVKLNLQGNVKEQVGTYLAAKHYLEQHSIAVSSYIDARVPGRVYYQ